MKLVTIETFSKWEMFDLLCIFPYFSVDHVKRLLSNGLCYMKFSTIFKIHCVALADASGDFVAIEKYTIDITSTGSSKYKQNQ